MTDVDNQPDIMSKSSECLLLMYVKLITLVDNQPDIKSKSSSIFGW